MNTCGSLPWLIQMEETETCITKLINTPARLRNKMSSYLCLHACFYHTVIIIIIIKSMQEANLKYGGTAALIFGFLVAFNKSETIFQIVQRFFISDHRYYRCCNYRLRGGQCNDIRLLVEFDILIR